MSPKSAQRFWDNDMHKYNSLKPVACIRFAATGFSRLWPRKHAARHRLPAPGRRRERERQAFGRTDREIGPGFGLHGVAVETGILRENDIGIRTCGTGLEIVDDM